MCVVYINKCRKLSLKQDGDQRQPDRSNQSCTTIIILITIISYNYQIGSRLALASTGSPLADRLWDVANKKLNIVGRPHIARLLLLFFSTEFIHHKVTDLPTFVVKKHFPQSNVMLVYWIRTILALSGASLSCSSRTVLFDPGFFFLHACKF